MLIHFGILKYSFILKARLLIRKRHKESEKLKKKRKNKRALNCRFLFIFLIKRKIVNKLLIFLICLKRFFIPS